MKTTIPVIKAHLIKALQAFVVIYIVSVVFGAIYASIRYGYSEIINYLYAKLFSLSRVGITAFYSLVYSYLVIRRQAKHKTEDNENNK